MKNTSLLKRTYLSHGYGKSHLYSNVDIICQSKDILWAISREGIGCITRNNPNGIDSEFICSTMKERFNSIYVWIYIISLYEYYGLQFYTTSTMEIYNDSLSIINKADIKALNKEMERIIEKSNLFYLQGIYKDISQISHQNKIFLEICSALNIDNLLVDFKENLDICQKYLKTKYSKNIRFRVDIIAILTILIGLYEICKDFYSLII